MYAREVDQPVTLSFVKVAKFQRWGIVLCARILDVLAASAAVTAGSDRVPQGPLSDVRLVGGMTDATA